MAFAGNGHGGAVRRHGFVKWTLPSDVLRVVTIAHDRTHRTVNRYGAPGQITVQVEPVGPATSDGEVSEMIERYLKGIEAVGGDRARVSLGFKVVDAVLYLGHVSEEAGAAS